MDLGSFFEHWKIKASGFGVFLIVISPLPFNNIYTRRQTEKKSSIFVMDNKTLCDELCPGGGWRSSVAPLSHNSSAFSMSLLEMI